MSYESFSLEEELNSSYAPLPLRAETDGASRNLKLQQAANRQRLYLRKKTTIKLRELLKRSALILYFEPVLSTQSMKITGANVILKIQRQGIGPVPAQHILSLVEDSAILIDIGCWMVGQILHKSKKFPRQFVFTLPVSAYLLRSQKFVSYVINGLNNHKIGIGRLQFALTEEVARSEDNDLVSALEWLSESGVTFSVSHLGTIEKAQQLLEEELFSTLVLDKYLVKAALESDDQYPKLKALCRMAHTHNCTLRVAGIEAVERIKLYGAAGINELQGTAISPAMPLTALYNYSRQACLLDTAAAE